MSARQWRVQPRVILVSLRGDRLVRGRAADIGGEECHHGDQRRQRRWAEVVTVPVLERCLSSIQYLRVHLLVSPLWADIFTRSERENIDNI